MAATLQNARIFLILEQHACINEYFRVREREFQPTHSSPPLPSPPPPGQGRINDVLSAKITLIHIPPSDQHFAWN